MTTRKTVSTTIRSAVLERDAHTCQKCGRKGKLELHHIKPITEGQDDTVENLVSLCSRCHREWEHVVYAPTSGQINFSAWLQLPLAFDLVSFFTDDKCWPDNLTPKQVREGVMQADKMMREFRGYEGGN